jgi:hypothetical protein
MEVRKGGGIVQLWSAIKDKLGHVILLRVFW